MNKIDKDFVYNRFPKTEHDIKLYEDYKAFISLKCKTGAKNDLEEQLTLFPVYEGTEDANEVLVLTRFGFDYEAKYNGECQEVTPAEFAPELTARIQELVKNAHYALGGAGYSRTDVRITKDGELFAIETNTLPGMTPTSLLPQQAACIGITYSQLIDLIIDKSIAIKR